MAPLRKAIVLLQIARENIELDAYHREPGIEKDDINDVAEDIGAALLTLESLEP